MALRRSICAAAFALVMASAAGEGLPSQKNDCATVYSQESSTQGGLQMENYSIEQWAAELEQKTDVFRSVVEAALEERYQRSFRISLININPGDSVLKLHLHPTDDETLVFSATVEEGPVIHENYLARQRLCEYEQSLVDCLAKIGQEAIVKASIPGCDTSGVSASATLDDILSRQDAPGILVHLALLEPMQDPSEVVQVLKASTLQCPKRVVFYAYVLGEKSFAACREHFLSTPSTTDASMTGFDPIADFTFAVETGTCRVANQRGITIQEVEDNE